MAIRQIIQTTISGGSFQDDKTLHTPAKSVDVVDDSILSLVNDLRDTMWAYPICTGLSAPQIGVSLSVSVVNSAKENRDDDLVLINPTILKTSGKKNNKRESCMSVWGFYGEVERRHNLELRYQDSQQNTLVTSFEGFEARIILHEIDHLLGLLYSDKLVSGGQLKTADFFNDFRILDG